MPEGVGRSAALARVGMASQTDEQAEAGEVVRQRAAWAVIGFVAAFATAWPFERAAHPGRDLAYAVAFAAEIFVALGALALLRSPIPPPRRRVRVAALAVCVLALLVASYHVAVGGELEVLALALLFLALGSMVTFPWGTRAQALVAVTSACAYGAALRAGVRSQAAVGINVSGFAFALGFTVLGAHLAEKTQRRLLRRDAELKRTNEELEQRSRRESEFLATMSHELRTPLNVIIGYLDLLEDGSFGALDADQLDPVQRAGRSARLLFELITATLDLSRLDAGVFSLDLRPVDLRRLVTEIALEARDLPIRPAVRLEWEIDPVAVPVETDLRMLKLVLRNLVAMRSSSPRRARSRYGCVRAIGEWSSRWPTPASASRRNLSRRSSSPFIRSGTQPRAAPSESASGSTSCGGWCRFSPVGSPWRALPDGARRSASGSRVGASAWRRPRSSLRMWG